MTFQLPALNFEYDALDPHIDAKTMEIHYSKHHQGYVNNLNAAVEKHAELADKSLIDLLTNLDSLPEDVQGAIRNNGGGHMNHSLFWEMLTPEATEFSDEFVDALNSKFGSVENFMEEFSNAALTRFGSGWGFLSMDSNGELVVHSMPNQDNPVIEGLTPLFGLDVWEHAYYLNYQNRRADYIQAFWHVLDKAKVSAKYAELKQ